MTKADDPFEEYLRKKKVELLETKFRKEAAEQAADEVEDDAADDFVPPNTDDPELEARVKDEAEDFFESGKDAGAELFSKADTRLGDSKVEEIRDALEDVFEDDAALHETEEHDEHAFVDFFRQVRSEYDGPGSPTDGPVQPEVEVEAHVEAEAHEEEPAAVADVSDIVAAAAEVSTAELVAVEVPPDPVDARLSLDDMLPPVTNEAEMLQRIEVLGRLVAKLVERAKLPENEIIEVLIRAGVEF